MEFHGVNRDNLRKKLLISIFLALLALAAYRGVRGNDFINYDDLAYVTENRHVQGGLSGKGLIWAFTASHASNWHPLTWISLMADRELFGMNAGGYHWTNVILHLAGGLLLFLALTRMTGQLWCSGLVAGLFLVHPLHVESVAWVAERKDVLSGLFWMLGMWGYARYVEHPGFIRYGWVLLFFVLGLMSKPMVVTFPFVLLLLDYWPLGRMGGGRRAVARLVYEKIPLFLLSAAGCVVTFLVQQRAGAVAPLESLPLAKRLGNAVISYSEYLVKTVWPADLAVFYPYHGPPPEWRLPLSLAILTALSLLAVVSFRRRPYLPVGWFWYLGTLVPVIGIVQVGMQAMADRYTYLPLIGIFMMIAWGGADILHARRAGGLIGGVISAVVLVGLAVATQIQVGYWKDSLTLFTHALRVTDKNYQAHNNVGRVLAGMKKYEEAAGHYREAIRSNPYYLPAYNNLGLAQMEQGRLEEARGSFTEALKINPGDGNVHLNRGELFSRMDRLDEAIGDYRAAMKKTPDDPMLHNSLGVTLTRRGRLTEALHEYREAIRLAPEHAGAHNNLAMLLLGQGQVDEAIAHFREAIHYQPEYANAHYQLALALKRKGLADEAERHFREARRINPDSDGASKSIVPERDVRRRSSGTDTSHQF